MAETPYLEPGRESEQLGWLALYVKQLGQTVGQLSAHAQELSQSAKQAAGDVQQTARIVGESLADVSAELARTRKQMEDSSNAAASHQRALVRWTAILCVATVVYAGAALLPLFWEPFRTVSRAWLLWAETQAASGEVTSAVSAFETKRMCEHSLSEMLVRMKSVTEAVVRPQTSQVLEPGVITRYVCLPDTVDPRGPRGK
jgi:hypothetical protein